MPDRIRSLFSLEDFKASVELLHRPRPGVDNAAAWRRMKFDELLAQQLSMRFAYRARRARRAPALPGNGPLANAFLRRLPFRLTRAQVSAFVGHARTIVAAGRPPCRLCGLPLDPDGHMCPRLN